jgi:hypothetical protein
MARPTWTKSGVDNDWMIWDWHLMKLIDTASAQLSGAEIVTRNRKHYPMADVSVVIPYERGG